MWLYILMGLLSWVGIYPMTFQLLMFVSFLFSITLVPKYRMNNALDFLVIIYIIYIFFNSIVIDYPDHFFLLENDIFYTILPMSFYFIAKTTNYQLEYFVEKMALPMVIVMVIGIILYIENPAWYSAIKYAQLLDNYGYTEATVPEKMMREAFRLSSIWQTSYVIGYANGTFILFLLFQLISGSLNKNKRRIYFVLFVLSLVVLILAGFKSMMLALVVSVFASIFFINDKKKRKNLLIASTFVGLLAVVFFTTASEYTEFFVERLKDATSEEGLTHRLEHTGDGIELDTFFGAGFARYSMGAKSIGKWFIQDSEYQKILAETGIFGFSIFVMLLLSALGVSLKKKFLFEMCIIITYTISFIGSSSISSETTFPFFFWFAVGSVSRKASLSYSVFKQVGIRQDMVSNK